MPMLTAAPSRAVRSTRSTRLSRAVPVRRADCAYDTEIDAIVDRLLGKVGVRDAMNGLDEVALRGDEAFLATVDARVAPSLHASLLRANEASSPACMILAL